MPTQPSGPSETELVEEVRKMLRLQDASTMAGSMGQLLMGLGVCLGAGFFLASFMTFILWVLFSTSLIGWRGWFWLYLLVLVPLIILYERKSRTDYMSNALGSVDPNPSSMGEHKLDQFILGVGAVSSVLLWGPRALVDGFRGLRGQRTMQQHAVFDRAAVLVLDLSKNQGGIDVKRLVHPPEDMQVFALAIDLLDTHGWIGKATDGKSFWLNSTFRQKLRDFTTGNSASV